MYSHDQKLITQFHFQYWSGYFYINPAENGYYSVLASLIYVGAVDDEDASSFSRHFKDLLSKYQENIYSTSVKSYDTWVQVNSAAKRCQALLSAASQNFIFLGKFFLILLFHNT